MEKKFTVDLKEVGSRIKKARNHLELTQSEAAGLTELSAQYWSLIETGRYRGSINTYLQIANAVGLTLNDLFYDETDVIRIKPVGEYEAMLNGMSEYEKRVLMRMMAAMKTVLIQTRKLP